MIRLRKFAPAIGRSITSLLGLIAVVSTYRLGDAAQSAQGGLIQQEGGLRVAFHSQTGKVRFLGTEPGSQIAIPNAAQLRGRSTEAIARAALLAYGPAFGLKAPREELSLTTVRRKRSQGEMARFQQRFRGVPILAGEIRVNLNAKGQIVSINGEISPDPALDTTPSLTAEAARATALDFIAQQHGLQADLLTAGMPELWVFDERLLRPSERSVELVWRMELTTRVPAPIQELVLVNAHTGEVSAHFNQADPVKDRWIYDNNNDEWAGIPGVGPVRTEGAPATGILDVDDAYAFLGETYDFYFNFHGRDSLDDLGLPLKATTRFCLQLPLYPCPYPNAFYLDTHTHFVFGEGYASADDVVAHEYTHGVTDHESNLFYFYQSGAINESLSDVWGEFVDLTNGEDNPQDRWYIGEDLPIGAIRSMKDPTEFGDPDRMTSENYYIGAEDNGGVHYNSGINNKAVFLMTDGGAFNGHYLKGLGIPKVAAVYYEAQTSLLTSGSDYADLYEALYQGCLNLIGGVEGITLEDCRAVRRATQAVEMNLEPSPDFPPRAGICEPGKAEGTLFFDDLESGAGNWSFEALLGEGQWLLATDFAKSGRYAMFGETSAPVSDFVAEMNSDVALPAGSEAHLWFAHAFGASLLFTGGWLEISRDGGATWEDAGPYIDSGMPYTDSIVIDSATQPAFVGQSPGYVSTRLDLSSFAGQNVRFRWRIYVDELALEGDGWYIDDVRIYTCETLTPTFTDVPFDHLYHDEIEALYQAGYTAGCGTNPLRYCPDQTLTRAQSAVFIERGTKGVDVTPPAPVTQTFQDVPLESWAAKWTEALYNDGFTVGCVAEPLLFCPDQGLTRAEGSVFYLRMLYGMGYIPPEPEGIFADVPLGWWGAKWIEAAYNAGLVPTCGKDPLRFCPDDPLSRGLAAYMMTQAKGLTPP